MGVGCLGAQWARLGGGPWVSRASPPRAASRGVVKISLKLIVRNGSHGRHGAGHARGHRLLVRHCDCPGSAGAATTRRPRHRHIGGICAAVR